MFQMNICAKLFWNPCINIEVMAWTSSVYGHFIIWPSSVSFTFNLPVQMFQMTLLLLKVHNCAKLFWNPCINVEVMAQTRSIYDHFIIWPSSVSLTFNLPEQMFQMNICAKLFLNKCINVEVMAQTSSVYDHFIIWPSSVTLTIYLPEQVFQINNWAKLFWNPCINVDVMAQTSSIYEWPFYNLTFKCDLDLQLTWTNVSNGSTTSQGEKNMSNYFEIHA